MWWLGHNTERQAHGTVRRVQTGDLAAGWQYRSALRPFSCTQPHIFQRNLTCVPAWTVLGLASAALGDSVTVPPCLCVCRGRSGPGSDGSERQARWTGSWTWTGTRRSPSSTPGSDISCSSSASCFGWVELQLTLDMLILAERHWKRCDAFLGFWTSQKARKRTRGLAVFSDVLGATRQKRSLLTALVLFLVWHSSIYTDTYLLMQLRSLGLVAHSYQTVLSQATSSTPANLVVSHLHFFFSPTAFDSAAQRFYNTTMYSNTQTNKRVKCRAEAINK